MTTKFYTQATEQMKAICAENKQMQHDVSAELAKQKQLNEFANIVTNAQFKNMLK